MLSNDTITKRCVILSAVYSMVCDTIIVALAIATFVLR